MGNGVLELNVQISSTPGSVGFDVNGCLRHDLLVGTIA